MQEFIIGREGNQPFEISNSCSEVSRHHCKITIDGDKWLIEDLANKNTTFCLEKDGEFRAVYSKVITPNTTIRLGEHPNVSCTFRAGDLIGTEIDWAEEWLRVKNLYNKYNNDIEQMQKTIKHHQLIQYIAPIIAPLIIFIVARGNILKPGYMLGTLGLFSLPAAIFRFLFKDDNEKLKRLKEKQKEQAKCPNPKCDKSLSEQEIMNMRCNSCKCKFEYSNKTTSKTSIK